MKRVFFLSPIFTFLIIPLFAESGTQHKTSITVQSACYFDDNKGGDSSAGWIWPSYSPIDCPEEDYPRGEDEGRNLGNGWGGAKLLLSLEHRIIFPFPTGEPPLTKDNNLAVSFKTNLAPVILEGEIKAVLTPIAFLKFETGASAGTGWTLGFNGLGINNDGSGIADTDPFQGIVSSLWLSGIFQFDLAAVLPGEWNHLVTVATAQFRYRNFSAAGKEEPWLYKADAGENFNGFQYLGSYVLGYQMPLKMNLAGFMVETEQYLGETADLSPMGTGGGWGSDFVEITFGPLINLALSNSDNLTVLVQMKTQKRYTDETIHNNYFLTRDYDSTYAKLERIALSYSHRF